MPFTSFPVVRSRNILSADNRRPARCFEALSRCTVVSRYAGCRSIRSGSTLDRAVHSPTVALGSTDERSALHRTCQDQPVPTGMSRASLISVHAAHWRSLGTEEARQAPRHSVVARDRFCPRAGRDRPVGGRFRPPARSRRTRPAGPTRIGSLVVRIGQKAAPPSPRTGSTHPKDKSGASLPGVAGPRCGRQGSMGSGVRAPREPPRTPAWT